MKFCEKLKSERARLGLTQAQASSLIDVPSRTFWEWEADKTCPYEITQEGALARFKRGTSRPANPR